MAGRVKVAGTWRATPAVYTKVAGSWRAVSKGYIKVAGTWRLWFLAAITDSFTRTTTAGTLGNTDTGNIWSNLRGSWFSNGTQAQESATAGSSYPLAVVELGSSNMIVSADITHATGVVVWGVDANNWWAVVGTNNNFNFQYTGTCTSCVACNTCSSHTCSPGLCNNAVADTNNCCINVTIYSCSGYCNAADSYGNCVDWQYNCGYTTECVGDTYPCNDAEPDTNDCGCCSVASTCCTDYQCTQTGTATQYQVKLLRSVAGTVTEINATNVSQAGQATRVVVTTSGNTLSYTAYIGATSVGTYSAAQTSPNTGTKPGIIKGPATNASAFTVDNFAASPN
jgi:hypothetical protein